MAGGVPLREIAAVFLKLGTTAFGGPAAHVAMMEDEVVRRRGWVTPEAFLDMVGAANLVPGPNSTELALHLGLAKGGWRGLFVAGLCFIAPAMAIVMALAWAYQRYAGLPALDGVMWGVKPVVLAIVSQALVRLAPSALKDRSLALLGGGAAAAALAGAGELPVILACGLAMLAWRGGGVRLAVWAVPPPLLAAAVAPKVGLWPLFAFFLKVGAVLYGSGYVLLAYMRTDLVERWGWLSEAQLLDAIAVGQVTPGPVFTTATFVGWLVAGPAGAVVATVGIFAPAFVFVAASGWLVPRIRASARAGHFLDGVNAGSWAVMLAVGLQLGQPLLRDPLALATFAASAALLVGTRLNATWLMLAGAAIGLVQIGAHMR